MRVLYVMDRGILGGIQRHTQCLADCLRDVCEVAVCINGEAGPLGRQMAESGIKVYALNCMSGHDPRAIIRFGRVMKAFHPDVVHGQVLPLFCQFWLKLFGRRFPVVESLHTRDSSRGRMFRALVKKLFGCQVHYFLPVSQATWDAFKRFYPKAKGEVFYNPLRLDLKCGASQELSDRGRRVIGMAGRKVLAKDWPSFCAVAEKCPEVEAWGIGVSEEEAVSEWGRVAQSVCWKGAQPNGREWIRKMDLFVLSSRNEQMPTVVLECFAEKIPICGFIPSGGMREILAYSSGPLMQQQQVMGFVG